MEDLLRELITEVKGLREDMKGNRIDTQTMIATLNDVKSSLYTTSEDGQKIPIVEVLGEACDILDQNDQHLQWMCDRQADAINTMADMQEHQVAQPAVAVAEAEIH
jgi:hypothetical protein